MPIYTYGKKLTDQNGDIILPYTKAKFVYMANNKTVEDVLSLYGPKIEKDVEITDVIRSEDNCLSYNRTNGQWGLYNSGSYISFNQNDKVAFLIRLANSQTYNISKLVFTGQIAGPAALSIRKKRIPIWPVTSNPNTLEDGDSSIYFNTTIGDSGAQFTKEYTVDIDNSAEHGDYGIYVEIDVGNIPGNVSLSIFGNKTKKDPIIQKSTFFTQINTNNTVDGDVNPYSGKSLEYAIMHIKGEIDKKSKK